MKIVRLNIGGVAVVVAKEVKATPGLTVRLGTVALRYIVNKDGLDSVLTDKFVVVADLGDVLDILSIPFTRNEWERQFRLELGMNEDFKLYMAPRNTTDVFPVRLNPTTRLYNLGWKDDKLDIRYKLHKVLLPKGIGA